MRRALSLPASHSCFHLWCCSLAGVSRSVTVTAAYLMTVTTLGWREALNAIRGARNVANPNFGFQRQLQTYESEKLKKVDLCFVWSCFMHFSVWDGWSAYRFSRSMLMLSWIELKCYDCWFLLWTIQIETCDKPQLQDCCSVKSLFFILKIFDKVSSGLVHKHAHTPSCTHARTHTHTHAFMHAYARKISPINMQLFSCFFFHLGSTVVQGEVPREQLQWWGWLPPAAALLQALRADWGANYKLFSCSKRWAWGTLPTAP